MSIISDKIKLARELNLKYNHFFDPETHRKAWDEIKKSCEENNIDTNLIQVTPDVFDIIVKREDVAKKYFK